jgi:phospholipid transport system substrate-binding protein
MIKPPALAASLVAALLIATSPRLAAAQDAQAFVSTLGTEAIRVLGPSVSPERRLERFRELFSKDFDVPEIGRFVLGRYWREATPQEQQEFLKLFQEYIVRAYSARLGQYGGEPFRVTSERADGRETIVSSQIVEQNGQSIAIDWYLLKTPSGYKITDVYVGGVSMAVTERDEFAAVIQRNGGQVGSLIELLRRKVAASN